MVGKPPPVSRVDVLMTRSKLMLAALPLTVVIAACSPAADESAEATATDAAETPATPAASPVPQMTAPVADVLALEGFGGLTIGEAVPEGSDFALRGAQASDVCLLYSATEYPGVYAIVEQGQVRRITVARDSTVRLVEGIGVGSTEEEVRAAFPGFVASPHQYVEAPGKYLQQPGSDPRLRFEIDTDGKVSAMHVGMKPQLEYVEGCS